MPFDAATVETQAQRDLLILRLAREEIAHPGSWYQGSLGVPGVSMCAIGWLVHFGETWAHHGWDHAERLLWPALPWWWRRGDPDRVPVARFNDSPWRRRRAIVRLYDRAIRLAERRL